MLCFIFPFQGYITIYILHRNNPKTILQHMHAFNLLLSLTNNSYHIKKN